MSSNIELVPFYTTLLRTIQNMFQAKLISDEQRSQLKNFVVSHDSKDLEQLFKSYEKGQLEQYILETYIEKEEMQISQEDEDDSYCSFSDIDCQRSTLSCTPNALAQQIKQTKTKIHKEGGRKRSNSLTGKAQE